MTYSICSLTNTLRKELEKKIEDLHDVDDIVAALGDMNPDEGNEVRELLEGIAFYDRSVTDEYGDLLMENEVPSDLRVLKISANIDYVSDLEDLGKLMRGDLEDLVWCDRRCQRLHGLESPLRVLEMMRILTENDPESLVLDNFEEYEEQGLDIRDYENARAHMVRIEHPVEEYVYEYLIDREERKVYLLV